MVTPRWVTTRTQPIALDDVVRYLEGVCGPPEAFGQSFDVGDPEVITYREMMERIAKLRGKRPFIVEVPVLTPYLSSLWLHVVTPVKAGIARPLIEGLRNETVARDERVSMPWQISSSPSTPPSARRSRSARRGRGRGSRGRTWRPPPRRRPSRSQ